MDYGLLMVMVGVMLAGLGTLHRNRRQAMPVRVHVRGRRAGRTP